MRTHAAIGVLAVLLAGDARAEAPPEPRSEDVALGISIGATAASWSMVALAIAMVPEHPRAYAGLMTAAMPATLIAPSLGHWYGGKFATRGFKTRLGGAGVALVGVGIAMGSCPLFAEDCNRTGANIGIGVMIAGGGLYLLGTIDDIATVRKRVRSYNEALASIAITPVVTTEHTGVAIAGQF